MPYMIWHHVEIDMDDKCMKAYKDVWKIQQDRRNLHDSQDRMISTTGIRIIFMIRHIVLDWRQRRLCNYIRDHCM